MTKKHFETIATIINVARDEFDSETAERIAGDLAAYFSAVNPRFDRARFLDASGFTE